MIAGDLEIFLKDEESAAQRFLIEGIHNWTAPLCDRRRFLSLITGVQKFDASSNSSVGLWGALI